MNDRNYYTPGEIAEITCNTAAMKAKLSPANQLLLGILAGAFIAFASEGSNMAAFNLLSRAETYGLGRALAGFIFGTGLMFAIIAGGELFTGNSLMIVGVLDKKIKLVGMLRNWFFVYAGNLIGSVMIAVMMAQSGLFNSGGSLLGGMTIKIAAYKTGLSFVSAVLLGIMCNWIVCLAIWMATAAKDIAGKALVIIFAICLFVTSGFEHSVANMYYIPAGIFAKANADWAQASGLTAEKLAQLNWATLFRNNLLPVTLGNIIGGAFFVGAVYWFVYLRKPNVGGGAAK